MRLSQRLAPVLPHHAVAHEGGIFEIAGDVLNEFTVIVRSVLPFVIVGFDGDAITMFEKCGEQRPVGKTA